MKHLKKIDQYLIKEDDRYLTDDEIEDSYRDWTINKKEFKMHSDRSGDIVLERPYDPNCDECETEKVENFIIYDNGRIAFDNWYPEFLYAKMVTFIYDNLPEGNPFKN